MMAAQRAWHGRAPTTPFAIKLDLDGLLPGRKS
jgi:hypothetical protein